MAENTSTLNPFAKPYHPHTQLIPNPNNPSVHSPVPRGPRLCRSPPPRRREVNPKPTANNNNNNVIGRSVGRKRYWKNRRGSYSQLLPMDSETTSLVIKNIPYKYTKELLIQTLDNHCKGVNDKFINETESDQFISAYDYLYLPIDFKNGKNAGFAFVNFTNPKAAMRFKEAFDGKRWVMFENSKKLAEISKAKIQGKNAIINNSKNMVFTGRLEEEMPVLFEPARDGTGRVESKMITLGKN